jgi:hypothetical protein
MAKENGKENGHGNGQSQNVPHAKDLQVGQKQNSIANKVSQDYLD